MTIGSMSSLSNPRNHKLAATNNPTTAGTRKSNLLVQPEHSVVVLLLPFTGVGFIDVSLTDISDCHAFRDLWIQAVAEMQIHLRECDFDIFRRESLVNFGVKLRDGF